MLWIILLRCCWSRAGICSGSIARNFCRNQVSKGMLGLDKPIWWREEGCQKRSLHLLEQCPECWHSATLVKFRPRKYQFCSFQKGFLNLSSCREDLTLDDNLNDFSSDSEDKLD